MHHRPLKQYVFIHTYIHTVSTVARRNPPTDTFHIVDRNRWLRKRYKSYRGRNARNRAVLLNERDLKEPKTRQAARVYAKARTDTSSLVKWRVTVLINPSRTEKSDETELNYSIEFQYPRGNILSYLPLDQITSRVWAKL